MRRYSSLVGLAALLIPGPAPAQDHAPSDYPEGARLSFVESFKGLAKATAGFGTVLYPPAGSQAINKKRADLPRGHQLYVGEDFEANDVVLVKTRITAPGSAPFYVVFTEGPSGDYGFYLIPEGGGRQTEQLYGEVLVVPGNGVVYTFRRTNGMFAKRQQWAFANGQFQEIRQPFYAVDMKTRTLVDVVLLETPSSTNVVGRAVRQTTVDVLVTDGVERGGAMFFLVRTPAGLTGWVRVPIVQYKATVLQGIFWWGD